MKRLIFIALCFFIMSAFTSISEEKELNKLKNTLQKVEQEKENLDAQLFQAISQCTSKKVEFLHSV